MMPFTRIPDDIIEMFNTRRLNNAILSDYDIANSFRDLEGFHLQGAHLERTNLTGVNLYEARLQGINNRINKSINN